MKTKQQNARRWLGRATEARFLADAQARGLLVSRPFTEAPGYDAVVDNGRRLIRVQIKGCTPNQDGVCRINVNRNFGRSPAPHFDVLAVWMTTVGRWFFLPKKVRHTRKVNLRADGCYARRGWEALTK